VIVARPCGQGEKRIWGKGISIGEGISKRGRGYELKRLYMGVMGYPWEDW